MKSRSKSDIQLDFLVSALSKEGMFMSTTDILGWMREQNEAVTSKIAQIPLSEMKKWSYVDGHICHESGKFFSIDGIRIQTNYRSVPEWDQPIINQPEIGFLGFIVKKFKGVLHFLLQAKIEPGNLNVVQLSPTLQATRSNYMRVHGGASPNYLEYFTDFYAEYWWGLPATYAVASDAAYNLALNKFLVNQLGLIPARQVITDNTPERYRSAIREEYRRLAPDVAAEVTFAEDGYIIDKILAAGQYGRKPPLIFGSTWERDLAKKLGSAIVEISYPVSYDVVLNKSYVGYRGALTLLERMFSNAISKSA